MTESDFPEDSSRAAALGSEPSNAAEPLFGAVDIVEAFTAMRHEWRGQTKEGRALAEQIETAVASLRSLESRLLASAAGARPDDSARPLVQLIIETDHQLSRAVAAISQWEANRRLRQAADARAVELFFAGMSWIARRFARPLLAFIAEQRTGVVAEDPAIEGLNLVLARLRRSMHEQGIRRLDVAGLPFDAATMHAIGTVAAENCPSGHVAEQLSAAYYWQDRVLRFADVRVAK